MTYKFINEYRLGDWPVDCAICGSRVWFSDTVVLGEYTGRSGYRVCPDDVDPIDYGLVPYTIPAEQPIPFGVNLQANPTPTSEYWNYDLYDPMISYGNVLIQNQNTILIQDQSGNSISTGGDR